MDWILEQLCDAMSAIGALVRACVDDVGAVVSSIDHLSLAGPVFREAESAAGLALHPGKGVVVPVVGAGFDRVVRRVRRRLQRIVPAWAGFAVAASGCYLGYELGPCGGNRM